MDPIFQMWRAEIEKQLAAARDHLDEAEKDLASATVAEREAEISRAELAGAFDKLGRHQVATALLNRRYAREDELKQAVARRVSAGSGLKNSLYMIADLEQALRQLDEIAPAALVPEPEGVAA